MLLLLGFAGCDQETQALVENLASPYEKVSLRDLGTFAPSDTEDDWLETDLLGPEISLLEDGFMLLGGLSECISRPPFGTAFNPRSIFAGLQLSIEDEGFDFTYKKTFPPNAEESSLIYSADIDYMDLILAGEINSLSKLVAFLVFDDTEKLAALTADGNIKLSAKMKASQQDCSVEGCSSA